MKVYGLAAILALLMLGTIGCSKSGRFVYVVGPGTNSVIGLQEVSNGRITALPSAFSTDSVPVSVIVHPSGTLAFVANFSAANVTIFDRDNTKGSLKQAIDPTTGNAINPVNVGTNPIAMAMSPNGQLLYVLNQGSSTAPSTISAFTVDSASGNLTTINGSPVAVPAGPASIAISADSKFLYVASPGLGQISAFAVGSGGSLAPVAGSPFTVGTSPAFVAIDPQAKFLYVADSATNQIFAFTLDPSTGVPSAISGSPFAAGSQPVSLAVDTTGVLLVAANKGSNNLSAYSLNGSTGALSQISGSPFATGTAPVYVIFDSTNSFVYVADSGSNDIAGFAITNNTLKSVFSSPFNIATSPVWLASH